MQYLILGIYLVILVIIGIYSRKRTKTVGDFFLGGRTIGPWITAFAYGTTYFSAVMFVGYAGKFGWSFGLSVVWIGIANALLGTLVPWLLLGKPTRRITHNLNASTMPEFFGKRYQSQGLKIVAALIIFIFLVPYCASVYQGLGKFFESVFHIPYYWCMIIMAVFTAFYLVMGGYIATVLSDFFQGIIMIGGVILMIAFILGSPQVGGLAGGLAALGKINPSLSSLFGDGSFILPLISLIFLTSNGTRGMPQMVHNFYAIRDEKAVTRGTIVATVFALIISGLGYFSGAFGRLFLNNVQHKDMETIMPQMVTNAMPEVLVGLIIALLLAASMSTLSSLVLVSSSSISMDLLKGTLRPKMTEKGVVSNMRILCAVFVLFSLIVAVFNIQEIFTLMGFSWGTISGAFLAPFLLGVRWKNVTKAGAWAGVITGVVVNVGLSIIAGPLGWKDFTAPLNGSIAMVSSFIMTVAVSLVSKKFEQHVVDEMFLESKSAAM